MKWAKNSWQSFPIKQVPEYKNKTSLFDVERELVKRLH